MRVIIASLLLAGAAPALADAPVLTGEAAEAAAVVDSFHAALHRGDTAGAAILLSDDALIYEEGHVERTKAEYAAEHLPADAAFSKSVSSVITRRTGSGSGDIAWVASEATTTGSYHGKPVNSLGTETAVLRRAGSSWRITHLHWSSHPVRAGAKSD